MKRIYNGVEVTYQNETDYLQSNVVYLITFPDGKYYVGSTTRGLSARVSGHISCSVILNKTLKISSAIREFMKFNIKILDNETDKHKLRKLEEFYTVEYKSNEIQFGYNDGAGTTLSHEHKLKLSDSCKGKTHSNETKLKISESNGGHPFFDDFNNYFISLKDASLYYKCNHNLISQLLKSGKKSKRYQTRFHYV